LGVNEILAAVADATVGVGLIAPDWVKQVADWVKQVAATATFIIYMVGLVVILGALVLATIMALFQTDTPVVALVPVAMLAIIILIVVLNPAKFTLSAFREYFDQVSSPDMPAATWSPWFFILTGVGGAIFLLILVIGSFSDSPNVNIDPPGLVMAAMLLLCVATTMLGILGLFDYRFVAVARTVMISWLKIKDTAPMIGALIFTSILFVVSISSALKGGRALLWLILALIAGALFVSQLAVFWSYWG
jgi:hypothetical protein